MSITYDSYVRLKSQIDSVTEKQTAETSETLCHKNNLAVFGLPDTATELLAKIIQRQLLVYKKNRFDNLPVKFGEYIEAIYLLAGSGYIAASAIKTEKHIFKRYYRNIIQLFQEHGDFANQLSNSTICVLAKNIPQMINLGLIAFNLIGYPHYFKLFKKAVKTVEHSLEMFEKENYEINEAKKLFRKIFF